MIVCRPKPRSQPWFNDNIQALRKLWRRAEHNWEKDRLQVSYDIMRNCSKNDQEARYDFLAEVLSKNHHRPRVLLSTIHHFLILNPYNGCTTSSALSSNYFFNYFVEKKQLPTVTIYVMPLIL